MGKFPSHYSVKRARQAKVIKAPIESLLFEKGKGSSIISFSLWISMLDNLFVCSPSLNFIFPMMWGPGSNWQKPGSNRRAEVSSDLCYAGSGEWTCGRGTQESAGYLQGRPGPAENSGQPGPSPRGSELYQRLQYNGSRLGDVGETESVRQDEVCVVFFLVFPWQCCYWTLKGLNAYPSIIFLFSWLEILNVSHNTGYILQELKLINTKSCKRKASSLIQPTYCEWLFW